MSLRLSRNPAADSLVTDKHWKAALLKSSLPLEHDVAQICAELGWIPHGPFPYQRPNEEGRATEFSIDLLASNGYDANAEPVIELSALIECKYCSPDVSWVFAPIAAPDLAFGHAISVWQFACAQQIDPGSFHCFDNHYTLCGRGVALVAGEAKETPVAHGLFQLRYAVPQCAAKALATQHALRERIGIVQVIVPILVTTAPLWVLKMGISTADFTAAATLGDVATCVPCLTVHRDAGEELTTYSRDVASRLLRNSRWAARLDAVRSFAGTHGALSVFASSRGDLGDRLAMAAERTLVVTRNALPELLTRITEVCTETIQTRRVFGSFDDVDNSLGGEPTCVIIPVT